MITILMVVIGVADVTYVMYVVSSGQKRVLGVSTIRVWSYVDVGNLG